MDITYQITPSYYLPKYQLKLSVYMQKGSIRITIYTLFDDANV